ncbi:LysR family transcriptional regulator [Agrobacterium sp. MOPV5]|uniref:LysR family transcriptional regulator n=1 Tax=Agrobacterium leguminum TaxID=2792015 RepID=UPI0018C2A75F|nr:LysR family transcriptional regulator [Agrobacterium leguminum]MBG0511021.1 LysR family transcriptional regulator [Agrobacterium leguminum]
MSNTAKSLFGNVNLKLLHTFILVAEHKSFRFAAEETLRSQSAVSTQIKQLEEQLGVALFHRTTRQVKLTKEGELLLVSAKQAMQGVQACLRSIYETADVRKGRIALACSPTIAATRLSKILAMFEKDYPTIEIVLRELNPTELFTSLREEEVDFAIGPTVPYPEFDFEPLFDDPLFALVPASQSGDLVGEEITLQDLADKPLLVLNSASALRSLLEESMNEQGFRLHTKHQFSQAQTLISMVEAGLGIAVLTGVSLPKVKSNQYEVKRIVDPPLFRQVSLIKLRGRAFPPAAARLAQLVREHISAEDGDRQRPASKRRSATKHTRRTAA